VHHQNARPFAAQRIVIGKGPLQHDASRRVADLVLRDGTACRSGASKELNITAGLTRRLDLRRPGRVSDALQTGKT
jgi:hypothetical protein